jgi:hypothetical protein
MEKVQQRKNIAKSLSATQKYFRNIHEKKNNFLLKYTVLDLIGRKYIQPAF